MPKRDERLIRPIRAPGPESRIARPFLLALALALGCTACDSRIRDAKARLSPEERSRFELGQQLSIECWSCHDFYGPNNKIGPHLVGILGRRAASVPHFPYSQAMQRQDVVWDEASLRHFLSNPAAAVPGTTMLFGGYAGRDRVDALLLYIREVTRP